MRQSKLTDYILAFCLALQVLATIPVTLLMSGPAKAGRPALVVVLPWGVPASQIIARAGGQELGPLAAPLARLAVFDDPSRAVDAGAWVVLDADALASICGFRSELI